MTEIPAGWFNDPEDATQLRYWNGTEWTEHRSPRALAGAAAPDGGPWGIVGTTFSLLGQGWAKLLLLSIPLLVLGIGAAVLAYTSLDGMLEPGISEILDRASEAGFDPVNNAADEAFVESIEVSVGPEDVAGLALAALAFGLGSVATTVSYAIFLAGLRAGRNRSIGETYRLVARRFPRIIGIALLWSLGGIAAAIVLVAIFVLGVLLSPLTLIVIIPALLVGMVYLWPFMALAGTALAVAPTDEPPLRHTFAIVRPMWGPVAGRLLILMLVTFVISIAVNLGTAPIGVAGIWAGAVLSIVLQALQSMFTTTGAVVLYGFAGGRVDPAITTDIS